MDVMTPLKENATSLISLTLAWLGISGTLCHPSKA